MKTRFPGYITDYECSVAIGCSIDDMLQAAGGGNHRYGYPADWKAWPRPNPFDLHPSVVGTDAEYSPNVNVMPEAEALKFIEHTKQGLIYYRAHQAEYRRRVARLEKQYSYKLDYAINHKKDIPKPETDADCKYYVEKLGTDGPYALEAVEYLTRADGKKEIAHIKIVIRNAKRNLEVCEGQLVQTQEHIKKNKDSWGISDADCKKLIREAEAHVLRCKSELAAAEEKLSSLLSDGETRGHVLDHDTTDNREASTSGRQGKAPPGDRDEVIKAGFRTYAGLKKRGGRPKLKPFRTHTGILDLKFKELKVAWGEYKHGV